MNLSSSTISSPTTPSVAAPPAAPTTGAPLFGTVLVANRGEIACRVIRTLRALGIRSVAVYSDADAGARHVREADVAVRIGPAAAAESYLKIEAILKACRDSGAEAVHPGYGFLSENVDFARALANAGITFIGPGVESLNVMGDKIRSKNHVTGYGVPVVPGIAEPGMTDAQLIEAAAGVGFPLLIKPSAGGGGKGMHIVERAEDLEATLATARRVAASAFGDDTLFLERLVTTPRHIEVQVLADNHGNVIHLGERECSLQRRHQKVIEEAPSPLLESLPDGAAVRARIGEAACNAARSVNYSGAGTVEFLVSDTAPDEFFFMEMNTRLQVEHPVTEMVTGIDLVEWQVRIAAGEELTVTQDDVVLTGHSVEARVYAEIPERNFMPSGGRVVLLDELPADSAGSAGSVRVDSALIEGLEISSSYDPMISKVIAWGENRAAALDTLDKALAGYTALGIDTNVEYLRLLINDPDVRAGRLDTGLIERKMPEFTFRKTAAAELAAAALYLKKMDDQDRSFPESSLWNCGNGWRHGNRGIWRIRLGTSPSESAIVSVTGVGSSGPFKGRVENGLEFWAILATLSDDYVGLSYNGKALRYSIASTGAGTDGRPTELFLGNEGWSCRLEVLTRETRLSQVLAAIEREEGAADPAVRSPMPGTVVSVSVSNGDTVVAGQVLLSVEAMKMEHQLVAPLDGTVHISVGSGDLVKADQVLATIHPPEFSRAEDTIKEAVIAMGAAE
ncbi:acetyl/propionyl/methylcrotonyl-CoA carboxylase subunit alpha [Arthrobacter bambusae]|uniref:Biotin-dependent 3-methylcrotonyl-coenzyme A carboxylase alpha1 subunit n=1 Tax=Arthrobacter bambusae TaxID=1338426 RepID=A0AAW8DH98_9MICC|nr:biotin carboxylase N-terminal domain-containing protein [Arthrobacter bambusae]MDP9906028.1 acetyl-CoA/propionyl-CoA carboxylase biotin carboxyl carrier protein [Arthrobacter bambusae]MDQ0131177.1 acetyl-CoA/propionyl-CoA carboxylase biotin carboxyl carrier protein [Arthrobacter bambusae]MDQ0181831.1 acetyl-CoA/propionyl-CoA carboxylase biotin carboxyl carrier protein [Arthrobacter bambusae]